MKPHTIHARLVLIVMSLLISFYVSITIAKEGTLRRVQSSKNSKRLSKALLKNKFSTSTRFNKQDALFKTLRLSLHYSYWLYKPLDKIKKEDLTFKSLDQLQVKDIYLLWGVLSDRNYLVLCFRGSLAPGNFIRDGKFEVQAIDDYQVHTGFQEGYDLVKTDLRTKLMALLKENIDIKNIIFTGHSLGGALATIAALDIATMVNAESSLQRQFTYDLITYGAPRVGDQTFAKKVNSIKGLKYNIRIIKGGDLVPEIPGDPYYHAGTAINHDICALEGPVLVKDKNIDSDPKSLGNVTPDVSKVKKVFELITTFFSKVHKEDEFDVSRRICTKVWDHLWYGITEDEFKKLLNAFNDKYGNPYNN